jgi:hypothetical protein
MITETSRRQKKDGTFRVWFKCAHCGMYGSATVEDVDDFIARTDEWHVARCREVVLP